MTGKKIYKECMVRIGLKTYLFQLREEISFDIDCCLILEWQKFFINQCVSSNEENSEVLKLA